MNKMVAILALVALSAVPALAQPCQLCAAKPAANAPAASARPIHIDIETALDFSTAAHTDVAVGSISVDPATGERRLTGLVGVGGPALRGKAIITGEPFRRIIVDLPRTIQLTSTMGAKGEVTNIVSTLGPAPMIGADGTLVFQFGGKFSVVDNAAGEFHGKIQISADYQ